MTRAAERCDAYIGPEGETCPVRKAECDLHRDPEAELRADNLRLRARVVALEGHRRQWRTIALRLYSAGLAVVRHEWTQRERVPAEQREWTELVAALAQLEEADDGTDAQSSTEGEK